MRRTLRLDKQRKKHGWKRASARASSRRTAVGDGREPRRENICKEGSKTAEKGSEMAQAVPETAQACLKTAQGASNAPQESPKKKLQDGRLGSSHC